MNDLYVGQIVLHCPAGDVDHGRPAVVMSFNRHGTCDLNVFTTGQLRYMRSVEHVDSDRFKTLPSAVQQQFGAWQFTASSSALKAVDAPAPSSEQLIVAAYNSAPDDKRTIEHIRRRVAPKGVSKTAVANVFAMKGWAEHQPA
jgi:hypothetical protein